MKQLDILFVSTPLLDLSYPPAGPAVLQAVVKSYNKTCSFFDSNVYLYNDVCGRNDLLFEQIGNKFITPVIDVIPNDAKDLDIVDMFFDDDDFDGKYYIRRWLTETVDKILTYNAEWLGISVFSYFSQRTSFLLAYQLKKINPNLKIVIGGKGATVALFGPDNQAFTTRLAHLFTAEQRDTIGFNFYDVMLGLKLADLAIRGEGENAIMEIWNPKLEENLKAKPINFIRGRVEDLVMEDVPFVDYDDYQLDQYRYTTGQKLLAITGSKGCVRKCTFCDISVIWPKFKHRTGKHIAAEILHLYKKYGVKKFFLTDSLVNGSQSAFTEFVAELSAAKAAENISDITWHGQYITRPISQVKQEIYRNMEISGAEGLTIGVETGSDRVREHMAKKFTNADLDHEMEQFSRNNIDTVLLFFSSYPTETWEDFLDTLTMWMRYQKYAADRTIYKMTLGQPYTHHAETPLYLMQDEINLRTGPHSDILWSLEDNPGLDFIERLVRRAISQEVAVALNLPLARNTPELIQLTHTLKSQRAMIEEFFDLSNKTIPIYENIYNLPNVARALLTPPEVQKLVYDHITEVTINITMSAVSDTDWLPEITATLGNQSTRAVIFKNETTVQLNAKLDLFTSTDLILAFNNQPVEETYFYKIDNNNYNSTKSVIISDISINGISVYKIRPYLIKRSKFVPQTEIDDAKRHNMNTTLYTNGSFILDLRSPVLNDVIDCNAYQSSDDIKHDDVALHDLKTELVKYNCRDQEKWLTLLEQSKLH